MVEQTDCDVIYLDSLGLRYHQCESTSHNHAYRDGWHPNVGELLGKVVAATDAVKKDVPIFTEDYSSDLNGMKVGASHGINIQDAMELTQKGFDCDLTGTNLFRFYFPKFKFIELEPKNLTGVSMAMFNGNATHHHFTEGDMIRPMTEMVRVWGDNIAAFMSETPKPLVETGRDDVFMNQWPDGDKLLCTVWNMGNQDPQAATFNFEPGRGRHCVDVFNHEELKSNRGQIRMQAPANRLAAFAEMPRKLAVSQEKDGQLLVHCPEGVTSPVLNVFAKVNHKPSREIVFEDNFDGKGRLDGSKWSGVDDHQNQTGQGTATFTGGGTLWSNAGNGAKWDYTKTRTLEVSFPFPQRTRWQQFHSGLARAGRGTHGAPF